jgi:hypothetical protein
VSGYNEIPSRDGAYITAPDGTLKKIEYEPIWEYTYKGIKRTRPVGSSGTWDNIHLGKSIRLIINPDNDNDVQCITYGYYMDVIIFTILSAMLVFCGLSIIFINYLVYNESIT